MLFKTNHELVNYLINSGVLKSPSIINAFLEIDRKQFVKKEYEFEAYGDYPLLIGEGQTISQPWTVAFMLELLKPQVKQKILDVGFGSGWTTSLLAHIVGPEGKVYGIEIIPSLFEYGQNNIAKFNFIEKKIVELKLGDGSKGWLEYAPFDRILVSASADTIPQSLIDQLAPKGILVIPDKNGIWKIRKLEADLEKEYYPGFIFVPLVEE